MALAHKNACASGEGMCRRPPPPPRAAAPCQLPRRPLTPLDPVSPGAPPSPPAGKAAARRQQSAVARVAGRVSVVPRASAAPTTTVAPTSTREEAQKYGIFRLAYDVSNVSERADGACIVHWLRPGGVPWCAGHKQVPTT